MIEINCTQLACTLGNLISLYGLKYWHSSVYKKKIHLVIPKRIMHLASIVISRCTNWALGSLIPMLTMYRYHASTYMPIWHCSQPTSNSMELFIVRIYFEVHFDYDIVANRKALQQLDVVLGQNPTHNLKEWTLLTRHRRSFAFLLIRGRFDLNGQTNKQQTKSRGYESIPQLVFDAFECLRSKRSGGNCQAKKSSQVECFVKVHVPMHGKVSQWNWVNTLARDIIWKARYWKCHHYIWRIPMENPHNGLISGTKLGHQGVHCSKERDKAWVKIHDNILT